MPDVLGPEYGALAGRTPEEALKLTMNYATELENKLGLEEETPPEPVKVPNALVVAKEMNTKSKEPITTEFIGNRQAAKAAARMQLRDEDVSFDTYDAYIEQVMSNMSAEQQTDAVNWVEAYWFIWGKAERVAKQKDPEPTTDGDPTPTDELHTEEVVHTSTTSRGNPRGRNTQVEQFKIEDPDELRTKQQFERILGKKMSNAEWVALQDESQNINTVEKYNELQESLKQRTG